MSHCRVAGCTANTDSAHSGQPLCMQGFAGDPEAHRTSLRDCMFQAGVAKQVNASGLNPEKLLVQVQPPVPQGRQMSRVEELEDVVVNLHQRVRLLSDDLASAKLAMQHAVDALAEVEKGRETMRAALREIDGIASMLVDALPEPINTQMWTIRDKISCALGKEV